METSLRTNLLRMVAFMIPFQLFGIPLFGIGIEPALVFSILFVSFSIGQVVLNGTVVFPKPDKVEMLIILFAALAFISLVINTGGSTVQVKPYLEFARLLFMITFFVCVKRFLQKYLILESLLKCFYYGMFIIALLGVWQFINWNSPLNIKFMADWSWATHLNPSISGWGGGGGHIGSIARTVSFAHEPTHLAHFLLGVIGISFIVIINGLRFPTHHKKNNILLALIIFMSFVTTFSIAGMAGFAIVLIVYVLKSDNFFYNSLLMLFFVIIPIVIFFSFSEAGSVLGHKIGTIYDGYYKGDLTITGKAFSTLSHLSHAKITQHIIVDHPFWGVGIGRYVVVYDHYSPIVLASFPSSLIELAGMNKESAYSLFFRMLSETGPICTSLFIYFIFIIFYRSFKHLKFYKTTLNRNSYLLMFGLILSAIGYVFAHLLKMGVYHYVELWLLLAMVGSIPKSHVS